MVGITATLYILFDFWFSSFLSLRESIIIDNITKYRSMLIADELHEFQSVEESDKYK